MRNSLYLNITIRCNADCVFCDRKGEAIVKGHNLKIEHEPTSQEVIEAIGDPTRYDEIVFCGYGEPTIRLDVVKEVARWVKEKGGRVRLNTDGHGNIINRRNIVPELVGLVDSVSVSLNSIDPKQYGELMQIDGERFHKAMIEFTRECKKHFPEVVMTVVGMNDIDTGQARAFVEKEIGAEFRVRPYF
jgi:TatD DNase family protein